MPGSPMGPSASQAQTPQTRPSSIPSTQMTLKMQFCIIFMLVLISAPLTLACFPHARLNPPQVPGSFLNSSSKWDLFFLNRDMLKTISGTGLAFKGIQKQIYFSHYARELKSRPYRNSQVVFSFESTKSVQRTISTHVDHQNSSWLPGQTR